MALIRPRRSIDRHAPAFAVPSIRSLAMVTFVIAVTVPSVAWAGVLPLEQERRVTALATASNAEDIDSSSDGVIFEDLGAFTESLAFDADVAGATAHGEAFHDSNIQGASFFALGSFHADASTERDDAFAEAFGRSLFTYAFRLTEDTPYTLVGQLQSSGNGVSVFQLNGPSGNLFSFIPNDDTVMPFDESGVLPAGDYDVFLSTSGFGQATPVATSIASGSYYATLNLDTVVSAPATSTVQPVRVTPNPVRHSAVVHLGSEVARSEVPITVHTAGGRTVRTLRAGAAARSIAWDGRDEDGSRLPPGVYFLRLTANGPATRVTLVR